MSNIEYRTYDHLFSVSCDGLLLRKGMPYTPIRRKDGYETAGRRRLVHRMVASIWIREIGEDECVHHKNHIKHDNRASNLEIVSVHKHLTESHKENLEKFSRSKMSEAGKQRLRDLRTGTKMPDETKRKIGDTIKRLGIRPPVTTGPLPAHVLQQRRENPPKAKACVVFGIRYKTFKDASEATGIKRGTLRKRCYSSNFPEYVLVDQVFLS